MIRCRIVLLVLLITPIVLSAQEQLNKLKAPTSPAAGILGIQPNVVLKPKSYQALETALFSNFVNSENNTIIPNDFSLEFTPYWTENHSLSVIDYLYPANIGHQFWRNLSASIASTQNYMLADSTETNSISFGARTTFYIGNKVLREKANEKINQIRNGFQANNKILSTAVQLIEDKKVETLQDFMTQMEPIILEAIYDDNLVENAGKSTKQIIEKVSKLHLDTSNTENFINEFEAVISKVLTTDDVISNLKDEIENRYGFSLDVAYATFVNFPTGVFEFSYVPKQAFWLTPAYNFRDDLKFLKTQIVLRYEWYNLGYYKRYFNNIDLYENNFDYGLAIAGEFKKFTINIELVGRESQSEISAGTDAEGHELYRKSEGSDFQCLGSFNYNLSDQIVLSYTLGNKFEPILNPSATLVSLLALNFGFGSPTTDDINE